MNNVDLIIKYLSGEMKQDETRSFEKDLSSNPVLKEEYEDVSAAFQLIREQLQKRDEDSFRANLLEVMEKYIQLIEDKIDKGKLSSSTFPMLYDRIQMLKDLPQKFGTQKVEGKSGKWELYKLESKEKVNDFRKEYFLIPLDLNK